MNEIFVSVKGYEGIYEVSNLGKVRSLSKYINAGNGNPLRLFKGKILKQYKNKKGYPIVTLCNKGQRKTISVHRLVAMTFIPNPDNLPQVNHKDEDKYNNCVDNLEWCTNEYNAHYGTHYERASKANINNPKRSIKVYQYTVDGQFVKEYPSIMEAKRCGFIKAGECCRGQRKTCGGYCWSFSSPLS